MEILNLLVIFSCLLINALISCVEMAFVTISMSQIRKLAESGVKNAVKLYELRLAPERPLSVFQIIITLSTAVSAALSGAGAEATLSPILEKVFHLKGTTADIFALMIVILPLTYLTVIVSELVPKTLALRNAKIISLKSAKFIAFFDTLLSPVVTFLEFSTKVILKLFPKTLSHPDHEHELNIVSEQNRTYVVNISNLEKKSIEDIMIPWNKVEYIDVSFSFTEVMKVCHETGHTRIPAVEKNSVVGFLHTKQFLSGYYLNGTSFWQQFISSMIEVHVASNPFEVLKLLQKNKNHMALVKNDIGESVGIITLEDILETVFGEIGDEDDDIVRIRKLNSMRGHF